MRPLLIGLVAGVALVIPVVRAEAGVTTVLPTFVDIKWLSSPDVVKKQLEGRGYKYVRDSSEGDSTYQGDVSSVESSILLVFDVQKRLVKVIVRFSDSGRPYSIFKAIKPKLEEKYGAGKNVNTVKSFMDGSETLVDSAIREDTAKLYTFWNFASLTQNIFMGIYLEKPSASSDSVFCQVIYEHDGWAAEYKRRSSKSDL